MPLPLWPNVERTTASAQPPSQCDTTPSPFVNAGRACQRQAPLQGADRTGATNHGLGHLPASSRAAARARRACPHRCCGRRARHCPGRSIVGRAGDRDIWGKIAAAASVGATRSALVLARALPRCLPMRRPPFARARTVMGRLRHRGPAANALIEKFRAAGRCSAVGSPADASQGRRRRRGRNRTAARSRPGPIRRTVGRRRCS